MDDALLGKFDTPPRPGPALDGPGLSTSATTSSARRTLPAMTTSHPPRCAYVRQDPHLHLPPGGRVTAARGYEAPLVVFDEAQVFTAEMFRELRARDSAVQTLLAACGAYDFTLDDWQLALLDRLLVDGS